MKRIIITMALVMPLTSCAAQQVINHFTNNTNGTVIVRMHLEHGGKKGTYLNAGQTKTLESDDCVTLFSVHGASESLQGLSGEFKPWSKCGEHTLYITLHRGSLKMKRMGNWYDHGRYDHEKSYLHEVVHHPVDAAEDAVDWTEHTVESVLPF